MRTATRQDIPKLVEMMRGYASQAPIQILQDPRNHNDEHVAHLLFSILCGRGFIVVDNDYRGMIAAIITPNVWCPNVRELRELAWWVEPEHRNKSIGGRLWVEFNRRAQELLDQNRVDYVCTTVMINSPLIDYTKRGFKPLEATFFRD